jgi:hypothetical protein
VTDGNQRDILAAFKRMLKELGDSDHEALFQQIPLVLLHQLSQAMLPGWFLALPDLKDQKKFAQFIEKTNTPARLQAFLSEQPDPSSKDKSQLILALNDAPRRLKKGLESSSKMILPTGGAPKKLSSAERAGELLDEIHERIKADEPLSDVHTDILEREQISLSTLQRRLRDERERRKIMKEKAENAIK